LRSYAIRVRKVGLNPNRTSELFLAKAAILEEWNGPQALPPSVSTT
jgi:hypothetical protein